MHVARMAVAVCVTLAASSADRALAADLLGDAGLRGSLAPTGFIRWDGWQFGVDVGYKYASVLDASVETARFKLNDYATVRVRAGYAMGQFLPYALVGAAVGRFNYANLNIGTGAFVGEDNAFDSGVVAGLGVDWAVTPAIFVRAEWEFIAFARLNSTISQINTGSLGIGLRF
jgi:opacity protein-like surface antigen